MPKIKQKTCKDGYYLNPFTNRCRKNPLASTPAECKEGYERNPITNRCRKKVAETGQSYPVASSEPDSHQAPQVFIAVVAVIVSVICAIVYVIFQFRREIARSCRRIYRKIRHRPDKPV